MFKRLQRKRQAELDYWILLSREITSGCQTEVEKRSALLRICSEVASPRYLKSLNLSEDSFAGMKVLDVGCGPHGGLMLFRDCEKYGVDHLIDGYRSIGYPLDDHGITYVDCKAEKTPFADSMFDAVVCINALDHVDDLEGTIREISRVLRPGGQFLGQFNFHKKPTLEEPHCLKHAALAAICDRNGLSLRERQFQYRLREMNEDRYLFRFVKAATPKAPTLASAEGFLERCVRKGLAHSLDADKGVWVKPYPEVTGYLLSYFATARTEEIPRAMKMAAKQLLTLQHKSGGFPSFVSKDRLFVFDTAQIMHGLASLHLATGESRWIDAAVRAAHFVCDMQTGSGACFPVFDLTCNAAYLEPRADSWAMTFSPIQCKNIEGLRLLHAITGNIRFSEAAERLAAFGLSHCDLTYTHPGAYCLEGLWSAGEREFVQERLRSEIAPRLHDDGYLPYAAHLPYAYVSGSVQMGILFFKAGLLDESRRILSWARRVQERHPSGGLFQYADREGNLDRQVHSEINSWGTKYFCELERLWTCGV